MSFPKIPTFKAKALTVWPLGGAEQVQLTHINDTVTVQVSLKFICFYNNIHYADMPILTVIALHVHICRVWLTVNGVNHGNSQTATKITYAILPLTGILRWRVFALTFLCFTAVKFGRMSKKQREKVEDEVRFHRAQLRAQSDSAPDSSVFEQQTPSSSDQLHHSYNGG